MFPLGSVLVPGGVLTLHVFEPRYRALVQDCIASADHEFGVVLIDRGHEVGGGDVRRSIGTIARMVQVAELDDGRFAVVAVGMRRLRVDEWLPDDPYPSAAVTELPDDDSLPVSDDAVRAVVARTRRAAATALELGDDATDLGTDLSDDAHIVSYQLIDLAPIGPADAYALLAAPGPHARLLALEQVLDTVEATQAFRLQSS